MILCTSVFTNYVCYKLRNFRKKSDLCNAKKIDFTYIGFTIFAIYGLHFGHWFASHLKQNKTYMGHIFAR